MCHSIGRSNFHHRLRLQLGFFGWARAKPPARITESSRRRIQQKKTDSCKHARIIDNNRIKSQIVKEEVEARLISALLRMLESALRRNPAVLDQHTKSADTARIAFLV